MHSGASLTFYGAEDIILRLPLIHAIKIREYGKYVFVSIGKGEYMRFRPCIDIHNGKVKQIIGGSLRDEGNQAQENFISRYDSTFYARKYREDELDGGHIIMLNAPDSSYYEATKNAALEALGAYPGGMQIGGGITAENASEYLKVGASHVIVTSYAFCVGRIHWENIRRLCEAVGREHVVLDLSCRSKEDGFFYVVTDRWQKFTDVKLEIPVLEKLGEFCDEFLVHGVDVEGKASGIMGDLVQILKTYRGRKVTYAGGIGSIEHLKEFQKLSEGKLDFTIGSALDLFGGRIPYEHVLKFTDKPDAF